MYVCDKVGIVLNELIKNHRAASNENFCVAIVSDIM